MGEPPIGPAEILKLYMEDIKSDNIHERLFTAGNTQLVAAALGPVNTRESLIPFLTQENHFGGEIEAVIAEQLGNFVKYVGGPNYASCLLPPLKTLCDNEDMFIRAKAIASMATVCAQIPAPQCDQTVTNLLLGMFQGQYLTSRIAACSLMASLYDSVSDQNKAKLRRAFITCTKDEAPIVRRAAIHAIPKLCNVLKQTAIMGEIVRQGLAERVNDDDESIRVTIPECLPAVAAKVSHSDRQNVIVPLAKALVKDGSWWVRANMTKVLPALVPYFTTDLIGSDMGSIILFVLRDLDPEVKTAACGCCKQIIDVLVKEPAFFNDSVIPEIVELSMDKFKQVREEVANDLLVFARIAGESVAKDRLFPVLANLIDDKERDVVIAAISSLRANFSSVDSFAVTQAVLEKLIEIATKEDFRVKIEIIRSLCLFLPYVTPEALPIQITPLIGNWLQDSVFKVREEICQTLPEIIRVVKNDSFRDEIVGLLMRLNYSPTYLIREAALLAVQYICDVIPQEIISEKLLPSVLLIASDPVPNVRILAAKTLGKMKDFADSRGTSQINLCLKLLANDADPDVKFFATR